jgi:F-box protein 28
MALHVSSLEKSLTNATKSFDLSLQAIRGTCEHMKFVSAPNQKILFDCIYSFFAILVQELRDISSMAIEHFDEKIVPDIKKSRPDANVSISSIYDMLITSPRAGQSFEGFALNLSCNSPSSSVGCHREETVGRSKTKLSSVVTLYKKQSKLIKNQSKQIAKMMKSLKQMKRRLDESDIKNREMTETIKQLKSTTNKPLTNEESSPQIAKKRTATMVLKRRLED